MAWPVSASGCGAWQEGAVRASTKHCSGLRSECPAGGSPRTSGWRSLPTPHCPWLPCSWPEVPQQQGWCPAPGAQAWLGHGGPQDILRKCTQLHGRRGPSVHKACMPEDSTPLSVPRFTGPAAPDPSRFPVMLFCSEAGRSRGTAAFQGSQPMERFLNPNHRSPPTGLCPQAVVGRSSGRNLTSSSARGWPLLVPGGGNQAAVAHSWVWRAFYIFFFFKKVYFCEDHKNIFNCLFLSHFFFFFFFLLRQRLAL